jgi:membrane-associated phospholipid phosphatase
MVNTGAAPLSRWRVLLALLAGYTAFTATYVPINRFSIGREAYRLFLPGEERLPFLPAFEYFYVTGYFLPLLLLLYPPDARGLLRLVKSFALVLAAAYTTYLAFPVYLERPVFQPDSLATWLIALEYRDPSYNHFPSLHVAIGCLIFFACRERLGRARLPLAVLVAGMCVSTLFVKQHYLVDVFFGAALSAAAWTLSGREAPRAGGSRAMWFRFEKLYADLVTADGTVCVAYLTRLTLAGVSREWAGLELYGSDGSRTIQRARKGRESLSPRELQVTLDLPAGPFRLEQTVRAGGWEPDGPLPSPHLCWRVEVARADARAVWTEDGVPRTLVGCGYADRVILDRPPRWLGLRQLRWGRAHLDHATVVWNALAPHDGPAWSRSLCWPDGEEPRESRHAEPPALETERVLHAGPALDPERFPGRGERWLTRLLSGTVVERRELSRAHGSGWALHEAVSFVHK